MGSLGTYAFSGCSSLKSVDTNGFKITVIPEHCFDGCSALTSFTFPPSVTQIDDSAFLNSGLTGTVTIPTTLTSNGLGTSAFSGCSNITGVNFGGSQCQLTSIPNSAFRATSITGALNIPAKVKSIGNYAFEGITTSTASFTLTFESGSELQTIGDNAFQLTASKATTGVKGTVTFPASTTNIGQYAFSCCYQITEILFDSVSTSSLQIGPYAFGNTGIASISFPSYVTTSSIKGYAFQGCDLLKNVVFEGGKKLTIESQAFYNCDLVSATFRNVETPKIDGLAFPPKFDEATPTGKKTIAYCQLNTSESDIDNLLDTFWQVNSIEPDTTFYFANGSTQTTQENTLTSSSYDNSSSELTMIQIGSDVTEIASNAFSSCTKLTHVLFSNGPLLPTIDKNNSFPNKDTYDINAYCDPSISVSDLNEIFSHVNPLSATTFTYTDGSTSSSSSSFISSNTYSSISSKKLQKVSIGSIVTKILSSAFANETDLIDVSYFTSGRFPGSTMTIGASAFQNCSGITTAIVPAGVTVLGSKAYAGVIDLKYVIFYGKPLPQMSETDTFSPTDIGTQALYTQQISDTDIQTLQYIFGHVNVSFWAGKPVLTVENAAKTIIDDYTYYYFKQQSGGSFNLKDNFLSLPVDMLLVGGGGCGGATSLISIGPGGGGAGGYVSLTAIPGENVTYDVTIGDGAVGDDWDPYGSTTKNFSLSNGQNSTITSRSSQTDIVVAYGGGGGTDYLGSGNGGDTSSNIGSGGGGSGADPSSNISGGAGGKYLELDAIASDISYNTSDGGSGGESPSVGVTGGGGGGGGAGAAGGNGQDQYGKSGGNGKVWVDGNYYAGGGAGQSSSTAWSENYTPSPSGGSGGGGNAGQHASPNTGGGGGGVINSNKPAPGGSGVCVIRLPSDSFTQFTQVDTTFTYSDGTTSTSQDTVLSSSSYDSDKTLTNVSVGSSVRTIDTSAFESQNNLTEVSHDNATSMNTIGANAYKGTSITSIIIPNSVNTLGDSCFAGCTDLTQVSFADGIDLNTIGTSVFQNSGITSIVIPDSVDTINSLSFADCANLTNVFFSDVNTTMNTIGANAFQGSGITSIQIPVEVLTIGSNAFAQCTALQSLTFADGSKISSIGQEAFLSCSALTYVRFPENGDLNSIGSNAFKSTGIVNMTIPSSVSSIGSTAFTECTSLASVVFMTTPTIPVWAPGNTFPDKSSQSITAYYLSSLESAEITKLQNDFSTVRLYSSTPFVSSTNAVRSEITSSSDNKEYVLYTFTDTQSAGSLEIDYTGAFNSTVTANVLLVAGGAAGGQMENGLYMNGSITNGSGGGGAGGYASGHIDITGITNTISFDISVGKGGVGETNGDGNKGDDTFISQSGTSIVTVFKGGGGLRTYSPGSGGGGSTGGNQHDVGTRNVETLFPSNITGTITGAGNLGGRITTGSGPGLPPPEQGGGGGGGAGSAGQNGSLSSPYNGGNGGNGKVWEINNVTYAGGGGGTGGYDGNSTVGQGGSGGGGTSNPTDTGQQNGTDGYGGGGSGGWVNRTWRGDGGSGVCILAFEKGTIDY